MKVAGKVIKVFLIIVLSVILLNIMLFALFLIPGIQQSAANFAIKKLQPQIGTEVHIDKVRIKRFNSVQLRGVYIEDQQQDTLAYIGELSAGIHLRSLMKNKINISRAHIDNLTANVSKPTETGDYNFQFLVDAFAAPQDTTPKPEKKPMDIAIRDVRITNGTLRHNIGSAPETPGQFNMGHVDVQDFNLFADIRSLDMAALDAELVNLSFNETQSGIDLQKLQVLLRSKGTELYTNLLHLAFNNSYIDIRDLSFDLESQKYAVQVISDHIAAEDVVIFAPMMSHMNQTYTLDVAVHGQIPSAEINHLHLNYGNTTKVKLHGTIEDFTIPNNTHIELFVDQISLTERDLETIIRIGPKDFDNVSHMVALEHYDLDLQAIGLLSNLDLLLNVKTTTGDIRFRGKGSMRDMFSKMRFEGNLGLHNVNAAPIIGEHLGVGHVTLNTKAGVTINRNEPIWVYADGMIRSVTYQGFAYDSLRFDGVYRGAGNEIIAHVSSDTDQNKFQIDADLAFGDRLKLNVDGIIDKLYVAPLINIEQWSEPYLMTQIHTELEGMNFDNIAGIVMLENTSLYDDNFIYNPGPIYLQARADDGNFGKLIQIQSSLIEGEIAGDYHFSTIGQEVMAALHRQLPAVIAAPQPTVEATAHNLFNFDLKLKNTEDLSYALSLPFINVEDATLSGTVDMTTERPLTISGHIPRILMGQSDIRETRLRLGIDEASGVDIDLDSYLVQDIGHIHAKLKSNAHNDHLSNLISLEMDSHVAQADGNIDISMDFAQDEDKELLSYISINPTHILFNDKRIDVLPADILYEKERIAINDFELREDNMLLLGIDGVASKVREDSVRVFFNNTSVEAILAAFNIYNIGGSINGGLVVHQALADPVVHTDHFRIDNIYTQKDTIGTLMLEGNWDNTRNGLILDADLMNNGNNYFCLDGFLPLGGEEEIDVSLDINHLPLRWIQPFAVTAFSDLSGTVDSRIRLSGTTKEPQTSGWIGVNQGVMTVAFTNVTYNISDTINISPDRIGLDNLIITDNNNHKAKLNVALQHNNFDGFTYNVNLNLDDFLLLNNEKRTDEIAYGTLKLSGDISLRGSSAGIFGVADLKNQSRSKVMIELPQTAQATEYGGIIYINTPQVQSDSLYFLRRNNDEEQSLNTRLSSGMPINIQASIDLNPQFEAGVEINPTTGDALQIKGRGKIRAAIDTRSDPMVRLYGDYIAEGGKFHYNFQNLKSIDFNISSGSTITLVGDPMSTQFDITAYNQVTADLATLSESFAVEAAKTRLPVNAKLDIQGNLNRMNVNYGVEVPDATGDMRQRINSMISTDEQKNKQFASLILTGNFMPAEGSMDGAGSNVATSLAIGQLAKGLDAIFASAFDDNWSISTNLQSTDGTFENIRMGVDVSTRLFDDRLRIATNLSYGDNSTLATQQPFMGEFELEYDINNWLMMRAYNRANQRFSKRAPTTQGAGVVVTKNSRRFRDLFKFSFRRKDEE